MSRNLNLPFFPTPPTAYEARYMAELVRSFSVLLEQMQNPGDVRATTITATELPTSDYGLETGAFFQRNGFVKVLPNQPKWSYWYRAGRLGNGNHRLVAG